MATSKLDLVQDQWQNFHLNTLDLLFDINSDSKNTRSQVSGYNLEIFSFSSPLITFEKQQKENTEIKPDKIEIVRIKKAHAGQYIIHQSTNLKCSLFINE